MHATGTPDSRTALPRSPSRPRSEMSSTTMASALAISFAALAVASAPSGTRNLRRSGMGVGLVMETKQPRWCRRCQRPTSLPSPSPSELTWVVRTTRVFGEKRRTISRAADTRSAGISIAEEVMSENYVEERRQGKPSRKSVEENRTPLLDALPRRFSLTPLADLSQLRIPDPIQEVEDHPDDEPHDEPLTCRPGKRIHQIRRRQCTRGRREPDQRRLERAVQPRLTDPEDHDADRDDHKRQQCADRHQTGRLSNCEYRGENGDEDAGDDRRDVGRLKLRMNLVHELRQETILRH